MTSTICLLQERWSRLSGNVRGGLFVLLAALFVTVMTAIIKQIGQSFAVVEILFIRQVFVLLFCAPVIIKNHRTVFVTEHKRIYFLRALFSAIAMITGFTAVVYLPLAEVTAISFGRTLFATILAILFLKEVVGVRRWTGTLIGFAGVVIIVQPDANHINIYAVLAIISAFFVAANMIILRKISQIDNPSTIMAYQGVLITLVMAGPAIYYWKTPDLQELAVILLAGGLMSIAQYLTIKGFKVGEAAAIAPMEYVKLIFSTAIGLYFFNEIPSLWTIVGALFIVGSTLYTMHRNSIKKQKIDAPSPDP